MAEQMMQDRANEKVAKQTIPAGYKQTEVGVIPEDWEATTVGQVTSWLSGGTPNRKREDYWQGDIPWISGSTLKTLELETSDQFLTSEGVEAGSKMAPLDATLLLVRGSALHSEIRAGLVVAPLCFNQDVKALIPNKSIVPRYLTIYLLAMENELLKLVSSAGNSAGVLDTELVKNFKFLQPPKHEQTVIANVLSDSDALIGTLEQLIAKKQAIKSATMQQLLTGRTRLPQFALQPDGTPKGYKSSELGQIPEDWEVKTLRNMLAESPKYGINAPAVELSRDTPAYIRITDISNDGYYRPTEKVGVRSVFSEQYILHENDIVLARTGASVGKSYLYKVDDGQLVYAGFLIKVSPLQKILNSSYLFQFMKTKQYWDWVVVNSMRSGQPGINGAEFASMLIPTPSINEQTAIATILSDMDSELTALEQKLAKARDVKQGMMQQLLTGRIRLPLPQEA